MGTDPPAPARKDNDDRRSTWALALCQLDEALQLLDKSNAPPELGADLDLLINRLRTTIESTSETPIQYPEDA